MGAILTFAFLYVSVNSRWRCGEMIMESTENSLTGIGWSSRNSARFQPDNLEGDFTDEKTSTPGGYSHHGIRWLLLCSTASDCVAITGAETEAANEQGRAAQEAFRE